MSYADANVFRANGADRIRLSERVTPHDRQTIADALSQAGDAAAAAISPAYEKMARFMAPGAATLHHVGSSISDYRERRSTEKSDKLAREAAADTAAAGDPKPLGPDAYLHLSKHWDTMRKAAHEGVRDAVQTDMRKPSADGGSIGLAAKAIARFNVIKDAARAAHSEMKLRNAEKEAGEPLPVWRTRGGFACFAATEAAMQVERDRALQESRREARMAPLREGTRWMTAFAQTLKTNVGNVSRFTLGVTGLALRAMVSRTAKLGRFLDETTTKAHIGATSALRSAAENRFVRMGACAAVVGYAGALLLSSSGAHLPGHQALVASLGHLQDAANSTQTQVSESAHGLLHVISTTAGHLVAPDIVLSNLGDHDAAGHAAQAVAHASLAHPTPVVVSHVIAHSEAVSHGAKAATATHHVTGASSHAAASHVGGQHADLHQSVDNGVRNIPTNALANAELELVKPGASIDWSGVSTLNHMRAHEAVVRAAAKLDAAMGHGVSLGQVASITPPEPQVVAGRFGRA